MIISLRSTYARISGYVESRNGLESICTYVFPIKSTRPTFPYAQNRNLKDLLILGPSPEKKNHGAAFYEVYQSQYLQWLLQGHPS